MWISLTPALFRQDGKLFNVMVCEKCDCMQGILDLGIDQQLALINSFVTLFTNWETEMNLPKAINNERLISSRMKTSK